MLPTYLTFMTGFALPVIQGFYLSFCLFITINNTHFAGIKNYVRALKKALVSYWRPGPVDFWDTP